MSPVRWLRPTKSFELSGFESEVASILLGRGFRRALLVLLAFGLLAHGRSVSFDFLYGTDDWMNFVDNPRLNPPSLENLRALWAEGQYQVYIPMTGSIWWACKALVGVLGSPGAFAHLVHALEVLAHLANAALIYVLAAWLLKRDRLKRVGRADALEFGALAGALFFLLHPVQVQSVSAATDSKEIFALLPALVAALTAAAYFESGSALALAAATGLSAAAMLSHSAMLVLPVALFFLGGVCLRSSRRRMIGAAAAWLPLALVVAWKALTVDTYELEFIDLTRPHAFPANAEHIRMQIPALATWLKPARALDSLSFYVGKTLVPHPLLLEYERLFVENEGDPLLWARVAAMAGALLWLARALWRRRREPAVDLGVAWALLTIAPALGFTTIMSQNHSDVANRYMYSWLAGLALVVAAGARRLETPRLRAAVAGAVVACLAFTLAHQGVWREPYALFQDELGHLPDCLYCHWMVGENELRDGRYEDAYAKFNEVYGLLDGYHDRHGIYPIFNRDLLTLSYKRILAQLGKSDELIVLYRSLAARDPELPVPHFALGNLLVLKGDSAAGLAELALAARLSPAHRSFPFPLGEQMLRLHPRDFDTRVLLETSRAHPEYRSLAGMAALAAPK